MPSIIVPCTHQFADHVIVADDGSSDRATEVAALKTSLSDLDRVERHYTFTTEAQRTIELCFVIRYSY